MMKLLLMSSILVMFAVDIFAEETPVQYSKEGPLHLKACKNDYCSFSGTQTLSGTYRFGFSEICENDEEDGCVALDFYPDNVSVLPHFEGMNLNSINISNYKESAQRLMGKDLSQKVMAVAKETIKRFSPSLGFGETLAVKGSASVEIEAYSIQICCDTPWAGARIVKVIQKSEPNIIKQK